MVAQPDRLHMSVEEYLTLDRSSRDVRYEYIDGNAYMLAGGNANHSIISVNITREFSISLRGSSCRVFNSDMRVYLSERRYVYPDASVSCDSRDRGTTDIMRYPRLVVEVLSPSTEAYDRGAKSSYYRACSTIEEYVLVDTQRRSVEVYRRANDTFWTLHTFGPSENVELESLNITVPVDSIYENVNVPQDALDL